MANPYHRPPGPGGGQFSSSPGGGFDTQALNPRIPADARKTAEPPARYFGGGLVGTKSVPDKNTVVAFYHRPAGETSPELQIAAKVVKGEVKEAVIGGGTHLQTDAKSKQWGDRLHAEHRAHFGATGQSAPLSPRRASPPQPSPPQPAITLPVSADRDIGNGTTPGGPPRGSVGEIEGWARRTYPHTEFHLQGFAGVSSNLHPETTRIAMDQYHALAQRFPAVARSITHVVAHDPAQDGKAFAGFMSAPDLPNRILTLSPQYFSKTPEKLTAEILHQPAGWIVARTVRGLVTHEFGHAVDAHYTWDRRRQVARDAWTRTTETMPKSSLYAATSHEERFAEGFSQHMHAPRTDPVGDAVAAFIANGGE